MVKYWFRTPLILLCISYLIYVMMMEYLWIDEIWKVKDFLTSCRIIAKSRTYNCKKKCNKNYIWSIHTNWFSELRDLPKLETYYLFKTNFESEKYLNWVERRYLCAWLWWFKYHISLINKHKLWLALNDVVKYITTPN